MKHKVSKVTAGMLKDLPKRSKEIITRRYGLKAGARAETLDAIGKTYGITRERVRQVEATAKKLIKKSEAYKEEAEKIAMELKRELDSLGGVLKLDDFFEHISVTKGDQDHVYFIIDITEEMDLERSTKEYHHVVHSGKDKRNLIKKSLESLYHKIGSDEILSEDEIIAHFLDKVETELKKDKGVIAKKNINSENLKRILKITKKISSNNLGGWGRVDSRNIVTRGIKDLAYLSLRELKKPLHFRDIVKEVYKTFGKKVNPATCHNELIRDKRFILVGRGIYGLEEWGSFDGGTVIEVIEKVLKKAKKALTKKEIVEAVLKKKQVKEQTVLINLGNKKKFKKNSQGKFALIK